MRGQHRAATAMPLTANSPASPPTVTTRCTADNAVAIEDETDDRDAGAALDVRMRPRASRVPPRR